MKKKVDRKGCLTYLWNWKGIAVLLTLICTLVLGLVILFFSMRRVQDSEVSKAKEIASKMAKNIQMGMDRSVQATYSLMSSVMGELSGSNHFSKIILQNKTYTYLPGFYEYGTFILDKFGVESINICENGMVTEAVPKGNQLADGAIGLYLPVQRAEQWKQLITRQDITVAGPVVLIQSPSISFLIRYPKQINNTWWVSVTLVLLDRIVDSSEVNLDKIWDDGYSYTLQHMDIETGRFVEVRSYVAGNLSKRITPIATFPCEDKAVAEIGLPGHSLYLHIFPRECWSPSMPIKYVIVIVSLSIITSFLLIVVLIIYDKIMKYKLKIKASHELETAPGKSGYAAILFTDIESSTKLWDLYEEEMRTSLQLHNMLVRECILLNNGYEVKTQGDSFMVAFHSVKDACKFSTQVQLGLMNLHWPQKLLEHPSCIAVGDEKGYIWRGLRVRIGFQFGNVDRTYDEITNRVDYFGMTVNCAARIEAKANGGQILTTNETIETEYTGYQFASLGTHLLRGIKDSKEIVQLCIPSLSDRTFLELREDKGDYQGSHCISNVNINRCNYCIDNHNHSSRATKPTTVI